MAHSNFLYVDCICCFLRDFTLFVLNILIATILTGWRLGIGMSIVGFYFGLELYKYYAGINEIDFTVGSPEFVSIYRSNPMNARYNHKVNKETC